MNLLVSRKVYGNLEEDLKMAILFTIWIIEEILNSKNLADEDKAMKHCVYSYDERIASGKVSIGSLQKDSERKLTVEVENSSRIIVQARVKYNCLPDKKEMKILNKWASKNK